MGGLIDRRKYLKKYGTVFKYNTPMSLNALDKEHQTKFTFGTYKLPDLSCQHGYSHPKVIVLCCLDQYFYCGLYEPTFCHEMCYEAS